MEFTWKRRWIWIAAAGVAALAILIGIAQAGPKARAFAQMEEAVIKWLTSSDEENLCKEVEQALKKMKGKYEARVAQKRLIEGKLDESLAFAQGSIQTLKQEAPFYAAFAETSILVEQGKFQEALEEAVSLKEKIAETSVLYGYNLLRIAFLQKALGNKPGEKAAWGDVEAFLAESSVADAICRNFKHKNTDLTSYISNRKRQL